MAVMDDGGYTIFTPYMGSLYQAEVKMPKCRVSLDPNSELDTNATARPSNPWLIAELAVRPCSCLINMGKHSKQHLSMPLERNHTFPKHDGQSKTPITAFS